MAKPNLRGQWALITGASSGLGADFARNLAARGMNLVLTARREEQLNALADDLRRTRGVQVDVIPLDLAREHAPDTLHEKVTAAGRTIDVLINNAGLGIYGDFLDIAWERERAMLQLDIVTLAHMTKLFARDMAARRRGYILQVASIGAFQPSPTYATYSAAKSFVLYFGEALHHELKDKGVVVTVVSPGVTKTEFLDVAGQEPTLYQRAFMMDSPTVVNIAVEALLKGKSSIVPGYHNSALAFSTRFVPRQLAARLAGQLMKY